MSDLTGGPLPLTDTGEGTALPANLEGGQEVLMERIKRAEAERDRLRGTLRLLVDTPNKLPTWVRHLARAALDEGGG